MMNLTEESLNQVKVRQQSITISKEYGAGRRHYNFFFYTPQKTGIYIWHEKPDRFGDRLEVRVLEPSDFNKNGSPSIKLPYFIPPDSPDTRVSFGDLKETKAEIPNFRPLVQAVKRKSSVRFDTQFVREIEQALCEKDYRLALEKIANYHTTT